LFDGAKVRIDVAKTLHSWKNNQSSIIFFHLTVFESTKQGEMGLWKASCLGSFSTL
jgi:hypothetical protein